MIQFSDYSIPRPSLRKLEQRVRTPEIMDQPELDEGLHAEALQTLQLTNSLSFVKRTLWKPIARLARDVKDRPIRVLDIASGGGDVACSLWKTAKRKGLNVEVHGSDISDVAIQHAHANADSQSAMVEFFRLDILKDGIPDGYDVITNTLFMHHLSEEEVVEALRKMGSATQRLVLINDILRSRFGYFLAYYVPRILSRSPVVHIDGPISIQGSFTIDEFRDLSIQAGLEAATFTKRWPERFLMEWCKP